MEVKIKMENIEKAVIICPHCDKKIIIFETYKLGQPDGLFARKVINKSKQWLG